MHCLAAGMGFSMLIYFCATGYREMQVINGRERGSRLDYIKQIDPNSLRKNHVFLDNTTGDIYTPQYVQ